MSQPPIITEKEFALLEEALTDLKKSANRASKARVEVADISDLPNTGFGAFIESRIKAMAEEAIREQAQKADGITLLSAKLVQYKHWQSQQGVSSNTASQA